MTTYALLVNNKTTKPTIVTKHQYLYGLIDNIKEYFADKNDVDTDIVLWDLLFTNDYTIVVIDGKQYEYFILEL